MMEKKKLFAGVLLFGSLWGFAECVIASALSDANLPAGAIMTGVFAFGLMLSSRMLYRMRGMQFGMGVVAGAMRLLNPFGGCHLCSGIAIIAEGALFELLWVAFSSALDESPSVVMRASAGVIVSYALYVAAYFTTQFLTPLLSSAGFYLQNLLGIIPQILAGGLVAALLGGVVAPLVFLLRAADFSFLKTRWYFPVTVGISAGCWAVVIANSSLLPGF